MKILHCSYSAHPDPPGGTEIYVEALCRALGQQGVHGVVAAPGTDDDSLEWNGVRIRRYSISQSPDLEQLYGASDPQASARFVRILDEEQPDVLHQHALTPASSSALSRHAKARGIPVVFTYHTPTVTCQRGTLMEWGSTICDGRLDVARCTACSLHGLGAGVASRVLAHVPGAGGRLLGTFGLSGGAWTALRMSSLLALRHQDVKDLFDRVDRFVVLAPWVGELLRANGVAEGRLAVSTHGIEFPSRETLSRRRSDATLRIAHLGRLDPTKGTTLLVDALRDVPNADISLDIYGVVQQGGDNAIVDVLARAASDDRRIRLHPAIPHDDIIETLAGFDLVAVPSQLMETGPLVALEAFAAGVPVIGSALGGLADKIHDQTNGLLVRPHDSVGAWRDVLSRCNRDRKLVTRLANGVSRPKSMDDVATEMIAVYESLTDRSSAARARLTASPAS